MILVLYNKVFLPSFYFLIFLDEIIITSSIVLTRFPTFFKVVCLNCKEKKDIFNNLFKYLSLSNYYSKYLKYHGERRFSSS